MRILLVSVPLIPYVIGQDDPEILPTVPIAITDDGPNYAWGVPNINPAGTLAAWGAETICPEADAVLAQLAAANPALVATHIDNTPAWRATTPGWLPPS